MAIAKNATSAYRQFLQACPPATPGAERVAAQAYSNGSLVQPTVLVNRFPLPRQPCDALFYPEFSLWCGTTKTADWHTALQRRVFRSTDTYITPPGYDGVLKVSLDLPAGVAPSQAWLRQVLLVPNARPATSATGGHFVITPMRAVRQFRKRLRRQSQ